MEKGSSRIRAPLRWAGSKRKSLATLISRMPPSVRTYVEPFAGSACLAFSINPERLILGDINPRLVEFYTHLKAAPELLWQQYAEFEACPETYYQVRTAFNTAAPSQKRAAQFLYLNRNCFNGIYRVNSAGAFNVPWGGEKVGKPLTSNELVAASCILQRAELLCDDFETVVQHSLDERTFVYLDPPYARDEERVFREYDQKSFATQDWSRLLSTLERINEAGAHFLMSYAGDPSLVDQLTKWNVGHLDVTRNVGGFKASRRKHREFIATNYRFAA
jgi:DNA adenine methylase